MNSASLCSLAVRYTITLFLLGSQPPQIVLKFRLRLFSATLVLIRPFKGTHAGDHFAPILASNQTYTAQCWENRISGATFNTPLSRCPVSPSSCGLSCPFIFLALSYKFLCCTFKGTERQIVQIYKKNKEKTHCCVLNVV